MAVSRDDTTESLFARVLNALFDTIIANRPMAAGNRALVDALVVVRATRLTTGGSIGLSIPGLGSSFSRSQTVLRPEIMIDRPRVIRDLSRFVTRSDAHDVVLHLNDLREPVREGRATDGRRDS